MYKLNNKILQTKEYKTYLNWLFWNDGEKIVSNCFVDDLKQLPRLSRSGVLYMSFINEEKKIFSGEECILKWNSKLNFSIDSLNTFADPKWAFCSSPSFDVELLTMLHKEKGVFNLQSGEKIYSFDTNDTSFFLFSNQDFVLLRDHVTIQMFPLIQSISKWSFELESLGKYKNHSNEEEQYEVEHFIGVWNNYLLIQLSGARLLVLDIKTGNLIKLVNFHDYVELPSGFYLDYHPKMQLEGDTLFWLSHQNLFHVNLIDLCVKNIANYFEAEREKQFRFFSNTLHEGKIYFCADYGWQYATPSRIGVMDAYSGEVLWQQQLEKTGGLPDAPQVAGDRLYIRTVNKELYIFEEEKSNNR